MTVNQRIAQISLEHTRCKGGKNMLNSSICDCCSELKQVRLVNSKELEYVLENDVCKDAPYHICEDCILHLDEVTAILENINDYFRRIDEIGVPLLYNYELPF